MEGDGRMKIVAKLDLPTDAELMAKLNVQKGGLVQQFIDSEVIRQCEPYVPFDEGVLTASAWNATDVGSGLVTYATPYAHYQYMGVVYGPSFKVNVGGEEVWRSPAGVSKNPTNRALTYNKEVHPQAGSRWFDRMAADHTDDILDGARKVAGAK